MSRALYDPRAALDSPAAAKKPTAAQRIHRGLSRIPAAQTLVPFVTVVSAASYAVLRITYVQFYSRLGLQPEEAGIDRTEILTQAIIGPVVLALFVALLIAALGAFYALLIELTYRLFDLRRAPKPAMPLSAYADRPWLTRIAVRAARQLDTRAPLLTARLTPRRVFATFAALGVVYAIVGTVVSLPLGAKQDANRARRGIPVKGSDLDFGSVSIPYLEDKATPAYVAWSGSGSGPLVLNTDSQCMLYLGAANGVTILYDVRAQTAVRLPSGSVAVQDRATPPAAVGCIRKHEKP